MVNKRKFIPEGVEDINVIQYEKKELVQTKIKEVFKSYGYQQILTPTFEYYD
ncbi:MAG: ATP phosphoribosyltransferase regulatory subunit, partial [Clostridiales bacterium]|nr:ATP phosphoribosyltransferase regulatory subunit [Clostridiales bacterium]